MMPETKIFRTQGFQDLQWTLDTKPGQPVPETALNHALLLDIRETLGSVRAMMIFFMVLAIIDIAVNLFSHLLMR